MARYGAELIVTTSCEPAVNDEWLGKAQELGVEVRTFAK
jgi:hypothetical protein